MSIFPLTAWRFSGWLFPESGLGDTRCHLVVLWSDTAELPVLECSASLYLAIFYIILVRLSSLCWFCFKLQKVSQSRQSIRNFCLFFCLRLNISTELVIVKYLWPIQEKKKITSFFILWLRWTFLKLSLATINLLPITHTDPINRQSCRRHSAIPSVSSFLNSFPCEA